MLCLGYSRRLFLVAEIGSWNAEDVVQGAFQETVRLPAAFRVSYPSIHPISMLRSDW